MILMVCSPAACTAAAAAAPATSAAAVTKWVWSPPSAIDGSYSLVDIACPSARLCIAIDTQGQVLAGTTPAHGGNRLWQITARLPARFAGHIACAGEALCVTVDSLGDVTTTTHPARAQTWRGSTLTPNPNEGVTGISCPSVSLCVAVGTGRQAFVSTNPRAAAPTWSAYNVQDPSGAPCPRDPSGTCGESLTAVNCPSVTLCLATDSTGHIHTSTAPARVAPWSTAGLGVPKLTSVSCASTSFCVASGPYTSFTTTNPTAGTGWRRQNLAFGGAWLSCPLRSLCLANDTSTPLNHVATDPSTAAGWHLVGLDPRGVITGVACPNATMCVAVDEQGEVVQGTGYVSPSSRPGAGPRPTGATRAGALLEAAPGTWAGSAPIRFSYQWQRCLATCSDIPGAAARRRRVTDQDIGTRLRVVVTATNPAGTAQDISRETRSITPARQGRSR
jgi:hypothetical protein